MMVLCPPSICPFVRVFGAHHPFRKSSHAWMNGNPWAVYGRGCVPSGRQGRQFLGRRDHPNVHQAGFSLIRG